MTTGCHPLGSIAIFLSGLVDGLMVYEEVVTYPAGRPHAAVCPPLDRALVGFLKIHLFGLCVSDNKDIAAGNQVVTLILGHLFMPC